MLCSDALSSDVLQFISAQCPVMNQLELITWKEMYLTVRCYSNENSCFLLTLLFIIIKGNDD